MPPFNIPSGSKFPYKDFEMPWELPLGLITYELIKLKIKELAT